MLLSRPSALPTLPALEADAVMAPGAGEALTISAGELARFLHLFEPAPAAVGSGAATLTGRADPLLGAAFAGRRLSSASSCAGELRAAAAAQQPAQQLPPPLPPSAQQPYPLPQCPGSPLGFAPPGQQAGAGTPFLGWPAALAAGAGADTPPRSMSISVHMAGPLDAGLGDSLDSEALSDYLSELSDSMASSPAPPSLDDLDSELERLSELSSAADARSSHESLVGVGELTTALALEAEAPAAAAAMPASPLDDRPAPHLPPAPAPAPAGVWPVPLAVPAAQQPQQRLHPLTPSTLAAFDLGAGAQPPAGVHRNPHRHPHQLGDSSAGPPGARRRHVCRFCPKAFVTPSKLARHERVHTGDKPYSCGHCSQRFTQRCGLKAHTYLHAREALVAPVAAERAGSLHVQKINGFLVSELLSAMQRSASRKTERTAAAPPPPGLGLP